MYLGRWNSDFIEVIDTNTYSVVASIPLGNTVDPRLVEVEQNPATNILVVRSGFMSNSILTIINTLTNTVIETIPTPGAYASSSKFAIDPTGSKLYFTNLQGLGVFDIATATLIQTLPLSPRANNIELSSSGELAYIDHDNGIYIVDINTMTVTDNVIVTDNDPYYNTNSMALHPNGEQAYLAGYGYLSGVGYQGVVYIVDLTSKSLVDTITFDGSYFGRIIFGPILETVGGSVTGMTPASIECQNNSTGQIVSIAPDGEASWDCESAGLTVDSGDSISISVSGSAK
jgi:YVTN family beta-propeller protein